MNAPKMTVGQAVFKFSGIWSALFLAEIGLIGFARALPVRRLVLPWLLMSWSGVVLAFLVYWARSPVDQPPTATAPRRFAVLMLVLININGGAMLVSAVALGVLSESSAIRGYAPFFLPVSLGLAAAMYFYARRLVKAA